MALYQYIMAQQDPFEQGLLDKNNRVVWLANFEFTSETSSSIETDVAQFIQDNSLGTRNVDLFIGSKARLTTDEDPIITIIRPGGGSPLRTQDSLLHRGVFQTAVRSKSYTVGQVRIDAIWNILATLSNITLP